MTEATKQNYTPAQTAQLVADYENGYTVEQLAAKLGKSTRSIVAKLSREGVYKPKTRQAQHRVRKAELVDTLARFCGVAPEVFESLEKANHEVLEILVAKIG